MPGRPGGRIRPSALSVDGTFDLQAFGEPLPIPSVIERKFFNPYGAIQVTQNRLPHWHQDGATCFVNFRLADSLPKSQLDQWRTERDGWMKFHPKPWTAKQEAEYHRQFSARLEGWLDQGAGSVCCEKLKPACWLRQHYGRLTTNVTRITRG